MIVVGDGNNPDVGEVAGGELVGPLCVGTVWEVLKYEIHKVLCYVKETLRK